MIAPIPPEPDRSEAPDELRIEWIGELPKPKLPAPVDLWFLLCYVGGIWLILWLAASRN